jgi:hypothetical protein
MKSIDIRKSALLIGAVLSTTALLAATQCYVSGWDIAQQPELYAGTFLSFLIPVILAFGLISWTNRRLLTDEAGSRARKYAWLALASRLAFLIIVPAAMILWGYPADKDRSGMVEVDSTNAAHTAWQRAVESTPVLSGWRSGEGDNTGGLTVTGMIMYRLFSPDRERGLLLGILAAGITSLSVVVAFRLADLLFRQKVAEIAALFVAVYPEAVLLGTGHQQQGYVALLLGTGCLAIAAWMSKRPREEKTYPVPSRRSALILLAVSLLLSFFLSISNFLPTCLVYLFLGLWMSDLRGKAGKTLWIGVAVVAAVLLILRVLSALDVISPVWDPLMAGYKYLYGYAWSEFDKMIAAGGGDLFQNFYMTLERSTAFVVAAFYGLLQPVLPAAIGHRLDFGPGIFWSLLGIYRGLGWFAALPVVLYATLRSIGGILRRRIESFLAIVFWTVAWLSSFRALGDLWDNPRYRLFVLIPLALLTAWGWDRAKETKDAWLLRIGIPFGVMTVGLTIWYFLRASVSTPLGLGIVAGLTAVAFFLVLFLTRTKRKAPTG